MIKIVWRFKAANILLVGGKKWCHQVNWPSLNSSLTSENTSYSSVWNLQKSAFQVTHDTVYDSTVLKTSQVTRLESMFT